jgi:type I restriction enzyme R subunit
VSNFAFVKQTLPAVHADCARAEAYLTTDPRTSCIYARRAAELLVGHLYDVLALPAPYKDDLSARINAPAFKTATGLGVNAKLNLIRHLGNSAVHAQAPIQPQSAVNAIRELHHVMTWAAFHHSPQPGAVPTGAQFDPTLASKMAPLSRAEVQKLADTFKKQDEAHAAALSEKDELLAAHEAEIARAARGDQGSPSRQHQARRPRLRRGHHPRRLHRRAARAGGLGFDRLRGAART